ncbi:Hypothetical_protein [Hexamita inflata]|uniref:Hypothetical_protein n=1 Tax=Hexamita inflata TaxID=28002 RepID=A0AA86RHR8_9EUKA|nr:Hypothetical protein HINF_LOCUS59964 [Hexamita inflata]
MSFKYTRRDKILLIEWDMGEIECENNLKQFEGEGFNILEIFAYGHEFDIRNIGNVANQVYMYDLEINLELIHELKVLSLCQCQCIGNFQSASINELLLLDTILSAKQLENAKTTYLSLYPAKTLISLYYPVIHSRNSNQLKFLQFKDTHVDLSTLQGNWSDVQFINCVCVNKMNNFNSSKVTFSNSQFTLSQLIGHCDELTIELSPHSKLNLFSEPFQNFGSSQNLKLIELDVDLSQIRGTWNNLQLNHCKISNSSSSLNDKILNVKQLIVCDSYPFNYDQQFNEANVENLTIEYTKGKINKLSHKFTMSDNFKPNLANLKFYSSEIDLECLKGKWGRIDLTNCKMRGENQKQIQTDFLHLISSNLTSEIDAKHIEAVSSAVLVNSSVQSLNVNNSTVTFKQQELNEIAKVNAVNSKIVGLNTYKCHKLTKFSMNNNKQSNEIQKQLKRKEELTTKMKKLQKSLDVQQQLRTKKLAKVQQLREKESKYKQTLLQPDKE